MRQVAKKSQTTQRTLKSTGKKKVAVFMRALVKFIAKTDCVCGVWPLSGGTRDTLSHPFQFTFITKGQKNNMRTSLRRNVIACVCIGFMHDPSSGLLG